MREGMARTRVSVALALALMLGLRGQGARAQTASTGGSAGTAQGAAEALFVEGKRLMAAGTYAEACAKLAASERLDPAAGTLLNLADCYEKNGQLASAWIAFRDAATASERNGRAAWAEQATARARILEPRLSTLTIELDPAAAAPGTEVTCDGVPLVRSAWGIAVPVDPSTLRLEVRAQNKKAWTATVTVDAEHRHVVVTVPPLEDLPASVTPPPFEDLHVPRPLPSGAPEDSTRFQWTAPRLIGAASVGVGVVGMGIAAGLALAAKAEFDRSKTETGQAQIDDSASAIGKGNVATGIAIGGAVVTVAGIVLWLAAPRARARLTTRGPGLVLGGSF